MDTAYVRETPPLKQSYKVLSYLHFRYLKWLVKTGRIVFIPIPEDPSGQIITTSADVTLNGGLIKELPQNPLNSGLGIILICPDPYP